MGGVAEIERHGSSCLGVSCCPELPTKGFGAVGKRWSEWFDLLSGFDCDSCGLARLLTASSGCQGMALAAGGMKWSCLGGFLLG